MDYLGGAPQDGTGPDRLRGPSSEDVLSEEELLGLEPEDEDDVPGRPLRLGLSPEALAIAAVMLGLAALMGTGWAYTSSLLGAETFTLGESSLTQNLLLTAGIWAPGLVSLLCSGLAWRAGSDRAQPWAGYLASGSAVAVTAMLLIVALGILYNQAFYEAPADQFG
jgi:hypothetical protein